MSRTEVSLASRNQVTAWKQLAAAHSLPAHVQAAPENRDEVSTLGSAEDTSKAIAVLITMQRSPALIIVLTAPALSLTNIVDALCVPASITPSVA